MNVQSLVILALTILLSLVRCTASAERASMDAPNTPLPQFVALLGSDQQRNVTIELGIVNRQGIPLEKQENAHAVWELIAPDGDLQAWGALEDLPHLAPEEAAFPLHWSGKLEPGHYILAWGCTQSGMEKTGFQVVERQGKAILILDTP